MFGIKDNYLESIEIERDKLIILYFDQFRTKYSSVGTEKVIDELLCQYSIGIPWIVIKNKPSYDENIVTVLTTTYHLFEFFRFAERYQITLAVGTHVPMGIYESRNTNKPSVHLVEASADTVYWIKRTEKSS